MQTATATDKIAASGRATMSDFERAEAWKAAWIAERRQNDQLKRLTTLMQWRLEMANSRMDNVYA